MRFEFATSNHILFGPGTITAVPALVTSIGTRIFFVTDSLVRSAALVEGLLKHEALVQTFLIKQEPDSDIIFSAVRACRESNCQIVISFGGGAALDTGKTVAALMTNPSDLLDYLEVVGAGLAMENPAIPCIAIPTTAGTGSEVTRNAVITLTDKRIKVSLRSPYMLPRFAIIDPELTYTLSPAKTASTGLDALTQLIEPFVCNSPNPLTD